MKSDNILHILRVLHGRMHDWKTYLLPLFLENLQKKNAVYLVMTPEHGNLGDHAIAQSEIDLLNKLNIPFIEITDKRCRELRNINRLNIMNGKTVLIHGGGNLGTLWPDVDVLMQDVVVSNPASRILMFPNTIYYGETVEDKHQLELSKQHYNSHSFIKMYARENTSLKCMKSIYRNVALAPDMVFRLNKCKSGSKREGCLLCLRADKERTRTPEQEIELRRQVFSIFGDHIIERDMVLAGEITKQDRDSALETQFNYFRHAELVITDRLHGMIFAAITGTPCIVINSKSPKVKGCYEWIRDLGYITFCDDVSKITELYKQITGKEWRYNSSKLLPLYSELEKDLYSVVRR